MRQKCFVERNEINVEPELILLASVGNEQELMELARYAHTGHCWDRNFEINLNQNCLPLVGSCQWWLDSIQMALAFGSCL